MRWLLTLLATCHCLLGATKYASPGGSDSNNGNSTATPYLTIQKGLDNISNGDTLVLMSGMYSNASSKSIVSSVGGPLRTTIMADTNRMVTNFFGGWVCSASNVTVQGIAFEQITNTARIDLCGIVLETNAHGFYGIGNSFCHFTNMIPNNHYAGYYMLQGAFGTPRPHHPWYYYPANCIFSNNYHSTIWSGHCYFIYGSNNIVVNNFIEEQGNGDAFYLHGVSNYVRGNTVTNVYLTGYGRGKWGSTIGADFTVPAIGSTVVADVGDSTWMITNLTVITRQLTAHFRVINLPSSSTATLWFLGTDGDVSAGSTITNGTGIGMSGGYHPDLIQTYGQDGEATGPWGDAWGMTIENNRFIDCLIALGQLEVRDTSTPSNYTGEWEDIRINDWLFRNNFYLRCGSAEGSISSIDIPCVWANNTFLQCGTNSLSSGEVLGFNFFDVTNQLKGAASNSFVLNNAFIGCGRNTNGGWFQYELEQGYDTNGINLITSRSNYVVHWSSGTWSKKNFQERTQGSFGPSTVLTVWPPPDINPGINPGMVNPTNGNVRPMLGSTLIDVGFETNIVRTAFDGMIRPLGAKTDVGAYEWDTNLLVHFNFEEVDTNKVFDVTGYGHHAYRMNPTNWISSYIVDSKYPLQAAWLGTPYWTNGIGEPVTQYGAVTNLTNISFLTNGTVMCWVKWNTNGTRWDAIFECGFNTQFAGNSAAATNSWVLQYGSPSLSETPTGPVFKHYTTGDNNSTNGILARWTQSRDGLTWHHIAVTWAAGGQYYAYEDGARTSYTGTFPAPYLRVSGQATPWLALGTQTHDGSPQWEDGDGYPNFGFLKSWVDDARIYNRQLSSNEVAAIFSGTLVDSTAYPQSRVRVRRIKGL